MMRPHLAAASPRTAIVAVALTAVVMSACTSSGTPSAPRARADEPVDEGLTEEIAEQQELVDERTEALEEATAAGTVGIVESIHRDPSPGWAGERIVNRTGNDWEPAIAADPNAPFIYILHNRSGGKDACANGCPDPAMILHVSDDGGVTWQPERFLCRCKGVRAQWDPLIEVVPDTGDVVAVWMNGYKIQFARSTDHGATWSNPVQVPPDQLNVPHVMEVSGGGSGIAYVSFFSGADPRGYAEYLRTFSTTRGWLGAPVQISPEFGDTSVWPGDTFGISTLSPGHVVLSWGSATPSSGKKSDIYAANVAVSAH